NTATVTPLVGDPNTNNNSVMFRTGVFAYSGAGQMLVLNAAPNSKVVIDATIPTSATLTINGVVITTGADFSNGVTVNTSGGDTVQVIGNVTASLNGSGSDTLIGGAGTN